MSCVFCDIVTMDQYNQIQKVYKADELLNLCDVVIFEPLDPCVKGHLLFVPSEHVDNIGDPQMVSPLVTASVYKAISLYLKEFPQQCNVVTNNGKDADQTVFHLHVHLLPRVEGDNVTLPWEWQKNKNK